MIRNPAQIDIVVVGGGPAGLAAAIAAAAKGFGVLVVDRACPPIEKACGEGLMPDSITALSKLGVAVDGGVPSFPFRGIRFVDHDLSVDADFARGHAYGVRRPVLHQLLVHRAQEAGVRLMWGAHVGGIDDGEVLVNGETVRYRWLIGADGQYSAVRRWAGLDHPRRLQRRFGYRRHYAVAPWTDRMELHWGEQCQFYITPVSQDEVCVVLMSHDRYLRMDAALEGFPALKARLQGAPTSPEKGAVITSARYRRIANGRVALIGDASGSVDAITGEGLCLAFQQAQALAHSLESGDWNTYELEHSRLMRRPTLMASLLLLLDRFPGMRRRAMQAFAADPGIFAHMLAAHVSAAPLTRTVLSGCTRLALRMLFPGTQFGGERSCDIHSSW